MSPVETGSDDGFDEWTMQSGVELYIQRSDLQGSCEVELVLYAK